MSKWRLWEDEYWGDSWNDRQEISLPQFEGVEVSDDRIEEELLSFFTSEVRRFVEIDGDEDYVSARIDYCLNCDYPVTLCKCDDTEDQCDSFSYHAERVK